MPKKITIKLSAEDLKKKLNLKDGVDGLNGKDGKQGLKGEKGDAGKDAEPIDTSKIIVEAQNGLLERILPQIPTIQQIEENLPKNGEFYRDALELLKDDDRLDKTAIKGLDDYDEVSRLAKQPKTIYGGGSTARNFTQLFDTPQSYAGQALKGLRVNSEENGLEFFTGSGLIDWGEIGGNITDQTDLVDYIASQVSPENLWDYTLATNLLTPHNANSNINLGSGNFVTTGTGTFGGLISPYIAPSADSTTAFQIRKADGTTSVLNVDTTNGRVKIQGDVDTPSYINGQIVIQSKINPGANVSMGYYTTGGTNGYAYIQAGLYANPYPTLKLQPNGGSVELGTLTAKHNSSLSALDLAHSFQSASNTNRRISTGYDSTNDYGFIQAWQYGLTFDKRLLLQPKGGTVSIGTTIGNAKLHILSTTGQLRLSYDSTHYTSFTVDATGALSLGGTLGSLQMSGGLLSTGTTDGYTIPSGNGTRMMWIPSKGAFRAGDVTETQWDDANIGENSIAFGEDTTASGYASTASGENTTASGYASTASGYYSTASGYASFATGFNGNEDNTSLIAGTGTADAGYGQIAMGYASSGNTLKAQGTGSIAMGQDVNALTNNNILVFGKGLTVSTANSFNVGFGTGITTPDFRVVSGAATVNGVYRLVALNTAPASASDTGTLGEIRWTNGYVYLCVATNTWQRASLATW